MTEKGPWEIIRRMFSADGSVSLWSWSVAGRKRARFGQLAMISSQRAD